MDCKETEIEFISSLINKIPNIMIFTSRSTLHHEVNSGGVTHAVCFSFTSLETPEPYLSALSNYLDETDNVPCAYDMKNEQWFFSNDVKENVKEKVKLFKDFAEANKENNSIRFLAAAIRDDAKKGATLHLYKDGSLVTNNFEPLSKPEMIPGDITHNSVTLNISPPRFGLRTVTHDTVTSNSPVKCDCEVAGLGKEKSVFMCTENKEFERLAESIKTSSLPIKSGSPSVFKLPLEKNDMGIGGCKSYTFGQNSLRRPQSFFWGQQVQGSKL
ncbi:unnamed protein product [Boreogadus saida]